jgi:protein-S-isoprenylcysteine O-methyltransferase Ste14
MLRGAALKRLLVLLATLAVWGALLFASAGRLDWVRGWLYLGLFLLGMTVNAVILARFNPELLAERGKRHEGTKPFDRAIGTLYALGTFAAPVVAGLDAVRFGWSSLAAWAAYAGVLLYLTGSVFVAWAMGTNPHLETTVRIQDDRGHTVITSGPYRLVRHPFYFGAVLQNLALPLVLDSAWAFLPAAFVVGVFVVRTALEDATLRRELAGYAEYAQQTPFRLVPGVW